MTAQFDRHALAIVESAYSMSDDVPTWLQVVIAATQPLLDRGYGVFGFTYRVGAGDHFVSTAGAASDNVPAGGPDDAGRFASSLHPRLGVTNRAALAELWTASLGQVF